MAAALRAILAPLAVVLLVIVVPTTAFLPHRPLGRPHTGLYGISGDIPGIDLQSIDSPVLRRVYPSLVAFTRRYGHPNIPLGNSDGRRCQVLRRLHIQGKLSVGDVALLQALGFRWHSLEDVYRVVDFEEVFARLLEYQKLEGDLSPPKKYEPDPELGAWVTGLRRLGPEGVDPAHAARLSEIGFAWVSPRQCGSSFMQQYRDLLVRCERETPERVWADASVREWVAALQVAARRPGFSSTRSEYMQRLPFGEGNWMDWEC